MVLASLTPSNIRRLILPCRRGATSRASAADASCAHQAIPSQPAAGSSESRRGRRSVDGRLLGVLTPGDVRLRSRDAERAVSRRGAGLVI